MLKVLRDNGLSLVLLAAFAVSWVGQAVTGGREFNHELKTQGKSPISFTKYLGSAHFLEATFENWESEFLQMSAYVVLTVFLYQRGSAESKNPDHAESVDEDPRERAREPDVPLAVKQGGWRLRLYEHSLSGCLFSLFIISWIGHALAGRVVYNADGGQHGLPPLSLSEYFVSSRFWFESFQNWQSEFLAMASIVVLSIWLRERGSPESKPVASPHSATGK